MPTDIIQWFPGHMAKTRRLISENLSSVDIIFELVDSRIPFSSKNNELSRLVKDKPVVLMMNKAGLADAGLSTKWAEYYGKSCRAVLQIDCITGYGIKEILPTVESILADKLERYRQKGMNKPLRAMVVGIPNVGKSSLINRLCRARKADVENRPGVTLRKQWIKTDKGLELLDMPGVLWPKFDSRRIGENLAITGAIKDTVLQLQDIAFCLCARLLDGYKKETAERFKLDCDALADCEPLELYEMIARKRGMIMSGNEIDYERCGRMLVDEFRSGKIGRITLDRIVPGD